MDFVKKMVRRDHQRDDSYAIDDHPTCGQFEAGSCDHSQQIILKFDPCEIREFNTRLSGSHLHSNIELKGGKLNPKNKNTKNGALIMYNSQQQTAFRWPKEMDTIFGTKGSSRLDLFIE
jgi:hypothetical protein